MLPRRALRAAVACVLASPGRTIAQVEADEVRGRARPGDAAQEPHRGSPVWHTKREIDSETVRMLRLDPSLCGPDRRSSELQTAVAVELIRLRRSGALADWNSSRRFNTFRLAGAPEDAAAEEGAGPPSAAAEPPPPPPGLKMTLDERPGTGAGPPPAAAAGSQMWDDFVAILRHGRRHNTYKFALARALVELCAGRRVPDGGGREARTIPYRHLARKFLRYYWHQEYRFRMRQSLDTSKTPRVISDMRAVWGTGAQPGNFASLDPSAVRDAEDRILLHVFGHARLKTSLVVPRFQRLKSGSGAAEKRTFYDYDDGRQEIVLRPGVPEFFRGNRVTAESLVTLEWAKYLERANGGLPGLVAKVEHIDVRERGQASLQKYRRRWWDACTRHCFYCRSRLERGLVHVDHFIPWSYIFDDDEWNLVLACPGCNLRKSNSLPQAEFRDALVRRNRAHEPDMGGLRQSLRLLDRGSGWESEIAGHYDTCLQYGFGTVAMP